jgi:iron complex outermembrane receptor protein
MGRVVRCGRPTLTMVLATALALAMPVIAFAQTVADDLAQAQRVFDIPPQPLPGALAAFGQQSGMQVSVSAGLAHGVTSPGVSGSMTSTQALDRLLAGTGITYMLTGNNTALLQSVAASSGATQLDPLRVQANLPPPQAELGAQPQPYAGGLVDRTNRVGVLGNRDYMDTPFSVTTYTEKTIQDQQAVTLIDLVAVDPTIRSIYPQGSEDDRLLIRGFPVFTRDMAFNGLYGIVPEFVVGMAGVERVEVFRGPTALLNGMSPRGAIGGTVNIIPKRAPDEGITQATARYVSQTQFGGQIDVGRRFGPDKELGLRVNASYIGGNTPVANSRDGLFELTLGGDFRGDNTRIDADFGYLSRRLNGITSSHTLAPGVALPAAPNSTDNYSPPWVFNNYNDVYGMLRFEHDVAPALTAFAKFGARRTNNDALQVDMQITDSQGVFSGTPYYVNYYVETLAADAGVRGRFNTGPVGHEMVLNASYRREQNGARFTYGVGPAFVASIYNPAANPFLVPQPVLDPAVTTPPPTTSEIVSKGFGIVDSLSALQDRLQLIVGIRAQSVQVSNYDGATGITTASTPGYDQSAITPSASLVVKPWKMLAFYGNYIEALEQGAVAGPTLTNAGTVFPPFVSRQFEVGAKLDLGDFGATLSAFQINRPSAVITAANALTVDGTQRNRGLELVMFGEPFPGFRPLGGITLLDPILTNTSGGLDNGKMAPGVSNIQLNLGFDWSTPFAKGLALSGRVIYTGQSYIDSANTQSMPAWTRVDLGARYVFERSDGKPLALRANVINVGNANYWMAGALAQGAPRTFLLSLTADF